MATLRDFQVALQQKIIEIQERDEFIEELEEEIVEKNQHIENLKLELAKYKSLVKALQTSHNSAAHQQQATQPARRSTSSGFQKKTFPSVRFKEMRNRSNTQATLVQSNPNLGTTTNNNNTNNNNGSPTSPSKIGILKSNEPFVSPSVPKKLPI